MTEFKNATAKVNKTTLNTLGDIQNLLITSGGGTPDEIAALSDVICGKSISKACVEYNLAKIGESKANTVNTARNRFATIMLKTFRTIAEPLFSLVSAEKDAAAQIEAEEALKIQLAEWETNGQRGRRPGESNRPKHLIAIDRAHAESRRDAREHLHIAAQGRITPEQQEKFVIEFRKRYHSALTALTKKYDQIDSDAEKIEKMVNKGVKSLSVSKKAQKAVTPKGKKNKGTEVPVSDSAEVVAVAAE